jgi:FixJ family two-component response regulator
LIAIVDDDAALRRACGKLLRSVGYEIAEYSSGPGFVAALTERKPLCVVLDLHMPELSGFEVQEVLARDSYDIPVIIVTADYTAENTARAKRLGAVACLSKPVDADRLLAAIAEHLK